MKKLLLLLSKAVIISASLSSSAFAYDLFPDKERDTNVAYKYGAQFAGIFAGLVAHEVGHIAVINYNGGTFEGFDEPYDNAGIPTLYMNGSGSQITMAAMMGNNTSALLSSYILNEDFEESDFIDGVLLFSLINPISYSLSPDGVDFHTASTGVNFDRETLRIANLIQSIALLDKAINHRNVYFDEAILNVSLAGDYIKVSNTGKIITTQEYWADNALGSINVSSGVDVGLFVVAMGRQQTQLDDNSIKTMSYMQASKKINLDGFDVSGGIRIGKDNNDTDQSFFISVDSNSIFATYDSYNKHSNLGFKFMF